MKTLRICGIVSRMGDLTTKIKESGKNKLLLTEILATAVLILFIFLCVRSDVRDDVSINEFKDTLVARSAHPEKMNESGAMKLRALYGLSANDYEETAVYIPVSNMDAQEMLLVRCRSEEQTKEVEAAMKKRIDDLVNLFESYGVEQMGIINKAVVKVKGLYCLYVCDENSTKILSAFEKAVSR